MLKLSKRQRQQIGEMGSALFDYIIQHQPHFIFELKRKHALLSWLRTEGKKYDDEVKFLVLVGKTEKEAKEYVKDHSFLFFEFHDNRTSISEQKENLYLKKLIGKRVQDIGSEEGTIVCSTISKTNKNVDIVVNFNGRSVDYRYPDCFEFQLSTNDSEILADIQAQIKNKDAAYARYNSYIWYIIRKAHESFLGRIKTWYIHHFSTPLWVYMLLFLTIFLMIILSFQINSQITSDFLRNISYGLAASFISAMLIDMANSRKSYISELYTFHVLSQELFACFDSFFDVIYHTYVRIYGERKYPSLKLSFTDLFVLSLRPSKIQGMSSENDIKENMDQIVQALNRIKEEALRLKSITSAFVNNEKMGYNFRNGLNNLVKSIDEMEDELNKGKIKACELTLTIQFKSAAEAIFPNIGEYFDKQYFFEETLPIVFR